MLTVSRVVMLIGVILIIIAAFGVDALGPVNTFELGVGIAFASALVP